MAMKELVAAERLKVLSAPSVPDQESGSGIVAPEFREPPPELPAVQPAADADYSIPGLRIELLDPPEPWALSVLSKKRQSDWVLHSVNPIDSVVSPQIPTIIVYQGIGYWIHEEIETTRGWSYRMKPAPEGEMWRNAVELSAEKMAVAALKKTGFK